MGYAAALGLVAGGVGMGMEISAQNRRASAMGGVNDLMNYAQAVYGNSMKQVTDNSILNSGKGSFNAAMKAGTESQLDKYKETESVAQTPTPPAMSNEVSAKKNAAWAGMSNAQKAPLEGYNEFQLQQMIKNLSTAQQLALYSQAGRGWQQLEPQFMASAANSQQQRAGWGQMLGMIGSGLSMGGLMGGADVGTGLLGLLPQAVAPAFQNPQAANIRTTPVNGGFGSFDSVMPATLY